MLNWLERYMLTMPQSTMMSQSYSISIEGLNQVASKWSNRFSKVDHLVFSLGQWCATVAYQIPWLDPSPPVHPWPLPCPFHVHSLFYVHNLTGPLLGEVWSCTDPSLSDEHAVVLLTIENYPNLHLMIGNYYHQMYCCQKLMGHYQMTDMALLLVVT